MDAATKAYDEIVELFARGTQPAKSLAFRPSRKTQDRDAICWCVTTRANSQRKKPLSSFPLGKELG